MQQVLTLLKKIEMLASQEQHSPIDIDLMLENTRAIYNVLLDKRSSGNSDHANPIVQSEPLVTAEPATILDREPEAPAIPLTLSNSENQGEESLEDVAEVAMIMDRPMLEEREEQEEIVNTAQYEDRDIRKHIGINDKYLFISELFQNDKEAYERALNEINRCTFCREATDWLSQQVKGRYNWDHENDVVQQFYGTVSHFFASR